MTVIPVTLCRVKFYRPGEATTRTCHRIIGHQGDHREDRNLAQKYRIKRQMPNVQSKH